MAAQIFKAPKDVQLPKIDFSNFDRQKYEQANEKYLNDLRSKIQELGYKGKNSGEVIRFQVADGYAQYMVLSMSPLRLIHLELDDAYSYQNVDLMTAKRVTEIIENQKRLDELFSKKQNPS